MATAPIPRDRSDFHVAILCALSLEAEVVIHTLDQVWKDKRYDPLPDDDSTYTLGAIGEHNVVIVHMPGMGQNRAAAAARNWKFSYPSVKLALVVGVCGGMPKSKDDEEILLGDVVISKSLIQYDFGKQYDEGFRRRLNVLDTLGAPNEKILGLLNKLETEQHREELQTKTVAILRAIQQKTSKVNHPGLEHDILYSSSYTHRHRKPGQCHTCRMTDDICEEATNTKCEDLGCESFMHTPRTRLLNLSKSQPLVYVGAMGCANTVMKSGHYRDNLARKEKIIAVEMEGAGVWRHGPSLVIKGVCDYADSHKRKNWQRYAAATAAACTKAFLLEWWPPEKRQDQSDTSIKPVWHVPFDPLSGFIGREDELCRLEQELFKPYSPRIVSLLGLGGVGKSRLAIELAFRTKTRFPHYSILWVQASKQSTFEKDILEIGIKLGIQGIEDKMADVKTLVQQRLSNSEHEWILILDNADDITLWGTRSTPNSTQSSLIEYLPRTTTGSILITTRSEQVARSLAETNVIELPTLPPDNAAKLFIERLQKAHLAADQNALSVLLNQLAYLPLALVQAASYINKIRRPIQSYIDLMAKSEQHILKLLNQDFADMSRYPNAVNAITATWLISFKHIETHHPLAATLLSRMACFHEKGVPQSLLLDNDSEFDEIDFIDAIAVLEGYSLLTKQAVTYSSSTVTEEMYDMHRLVQVSARNWLRMSSTISKHIKACTVRLAQLFPTRHHEYKNIWTMYLPHAQRVTEEVNVADIPERYELLEKMGLCFIADGHYDEAVKAHTAVVNWRVSLATSNQRTFDAYNNLGEALRFSGEWSRAEGYLRQAYNWQKEGLGKEHPSTLTSINDLALVLSDQGKYSEAEEMYR